MMARPRWPSAGPIGGEGFAEPAGSCSFRSPVLFFVLAPSLSGADLGGWQPPHLPRSIGQSESLHLPELQFDRRRPAVNAHLNFEQRVLVVNLLDGPMEGRKRTVGDAHELAHFERRRPQIEW